MRVSEEAKICSICLITYTGHGNNAQPVNDGICCDDCNEIFVIPIRRLRALHQPAWPAKE